MVRNIRNKTKAFFVQLLLGLIALSFVGWGFADYTRSGGGNQYAVKVGQNGIPIQQVENAVRQRQQELRNVIGSAADQPLFRQQITQNVIQQLIDRALYVEAANDLGLDISPKLQRDTLLKEAAFQEAGKFDRLKFDLTLRSVGLTEERYLNELKDGMQVSLLAQTMEKATPSSDLLTTALLKRQQESRKLRVYKADLPTVKTPSGETLQTYLDDNKSDFVQPDVMDIAYVLLQPKELAKKIEVSEKDVRRRYNEIKDTLGEPERRTVKLLLTDTQEDAQAVFKSPKSFDDLVAEKAGRRVSGITDVTIDGLPSQALGEVIFKAERGEKTKPAESPLGWHVAIVTGIAPAKTVAFDEVKKDLRSRLALEKAYEEMTLSVENILDSESSLFRLPEVAVAGKPIETVKGKNFNQLIRTDLFKKYPALTDGLKQAMNNPDVVERLQLDNDSLVLLEVQNKRAAKEPKLADIKADVIEAYKLEKAKEAAKNAVEKALTAVEDDKIPANFQLKNFNNVKNKDLEKRVGILAGQVQQSQPNDVIHSVTGKGITIVKVVNIKRPTKIDQSTDDYKVQKDALHKSLVADVLNTLSNAYRREYPVEVNMVNAAAAP